jgi:hypothetical protein
MIHKTPQLSKLFMDNDPSSQTQKQNWFRGIISDFHNKTPIIQNRDELLLMNRQTLSYMINKLSAYVPPSATPTHSLQPPAHSLQPQSDTIGTLYSRNIRNENREETYKREFEEREREYKSMSAPAELPKVNFALSEDNAISNIAELVEQHRKLRELDIQTLPPSQPKIEKLKVQEDLPTEIIQLDAVSLDSDKKRRVTFQQDNQQEQDMKSEIIELKTEIIEMKKVLFWIKENLCSKSNHENIEL